MIIIIIISKLVASRKSDPVALFQVLRGRDRIFDRPIEQNIEYLSFFKLAKIQLKSQLKLIE